MPVLPALRRATSSHSQASLHPRATLSKPRSRTFYIRFGPPSGDTWAILVQTRQPAVHVQAPPCLTAGLAMEADAIARLGLNVAADPSSGRETIRVVAAGQRKGHQREDHR